MSMMLKWIFVDDVKMDIHGKVNLKMRGQNDEMDRLSATAGTGCDRRVVYLGRCAERLGKQTGNRRDFPHDPFGLGRKKTG